MRTSNWVPEEVPLDVPNVARMWDYFLGGAHNFAVDRKAAEKAIQLYPDLPLVAQANRAFLGRAVRYLVQAGLNQFLDIGSGIPTVGNVHEIVLSANPDAHVVYVDFDRVAVSHSRAILADVPNVVAIHGDARQPLEIVNDPETRAVLDFSQPVAILLLAILHFVPDDEEAQSIVRDLAGAVVPGSYVAITHATTDKITAPNREQVEQLYKGASSPFHFRTRDHIAALLNGLELVEPGLVYVPLWRPDSDDDLCLNEPDRTNGYAAVARRP